MNMHIKILNSLPQGENETFNVDAIASQQSWSTITTSGMEASSSLHIRIESKKKYLSFLMTVQ